jgi:hypothetical protein
MEFVTDLKFMDFKASNGWLESWRSRFSIGFFKVCGESIGAWMVGRYKKRVFLEEKSFHYAN